MVSAKFLGGASLQTDDGALAGPAAQRHRIALVALLTLSRSRSLSRDKLIAALWPNRDAEHARGLLKQSVHTLRRALGDRAIVSVGDALCVNAEVLPSDVEAFESALAAGELEQAVSVYGGPLLDGFHLSDAPEFERWLDAERDRLRREYVEALERLADQATARGDTTGAVERWRRVAAEEPYSGRITVRLMEALDAAGDRAGAIQQARAHAFLLQQEFEAEPDAPVLALAEQLRANPTNGARGHGAERVTSRTTSHQDGPRLTPATSAGPASVRYPLIGRDAEWARLRAAWTDKASGGSHFALILGEAGIGKTRLAEELLEWAVKHAIATARTRCYAAEGRLPYAPVADWLRSPTLQSGLGMLDATWISEVARLLPELSSARPDLEAPDVMGTWQRQRLFTAISHAVFVRGEPTVLLLDDLQWCDQETLEWLHYLLRFPAAPRLLVVGTARDEELTPGHPLTTLVHDLRGEQKITVVELRALSADATASLGAKVAGTALTPEVTAQLYRETEGHPLFVVESVRVRLLDPATSAAGDGAATTSANSLLGDVESLSPAVQAVIQTRLSRLSPPARALAGVAATIGRDFTIEVLSRAGDAGEEAMVSLDELCQRRIVREHGAGRFDFSHDKLREVAYRSVGPARRRVLHRRTAEALAIVHAPNLAPVSAQIAAHYEQGGAAEQAVAFYQRAAEVATRIYANEQAVGLLERALEILLTLPENAERDRREFLVRIALCAPFRASKGWATPELTGNVLRARVLGDRVGTDLERLGVMWEEVAFRVVRCDLQSAIVTADEALSIALAHGDPALLAPAHHWMGAPLTQSGEFARARGFIDRAVALYDRAYHGRHVAMFGADFGVLARVFNVHVLWHLGYPDQALAVSQQAIGLAEELAHPFCRAIALVYDATLRQFQRDCLTTEREAAALLALSAEYGFTYYDAWGTILHGWALAMQGKARRGIKELQNGINAMCATGTEGRRSYFLSLLAEGCAANDQAPEALAVISDALTLSETNGERWKDAELHRLRGELLLAQSANESEAEGCFRKAIEVARRQDAKMLELRATVSLARLQRRLGRCSEARETLAAVYGWFTEGFGSQDLIEARALLADLS